MKNFHTKLRLWHLDNGRQLPWTGIKDPYKIWLSEIILQQTRVEHGIFYYKKFIDTFPSVRHLAEASEDMVLKMWEGLGYYSRARNLHATAKFINNDKGGKFPESFIEILQLKGIGTYTAAAIASFAFGLPYAAVDANVIRILSRISGTADDISLPETKKKLTELAEKVLDSDQPAKHNQAMMDFGALVCRPRNPLCGDCPFKQDCYAFMQDLTEFLPVKQKMRQRKKRYFHYFVILQSNKTIIEKRTQKDIWINLYQFPLIEESQILSFNKIRQSPQFNDIFGSADCSLVKESAKVYQQLTHQEIQARFFIVNVKHTALRESGAFIKVGRHDLHKFAFPGLIRESLKDLCNFID